jgi:outer membrane protein assembly factor BamD (BamD/ComL family)
MKLYQALFIFCCCVGHINSAYSQTAEEQYEEGNEKLEQKEYEAAVRRYNRAITQNPKFADAYFKRAI